MTQHYFLKTAAIFTFSSLAIAFGALIYFGYQDYTHPKHVYGRWIELGVPSYQTEILVLNSDGVFRNQRLIATKFDFDGKQVTIETGDGSSIYKIAGTHNSPRLKRIAPDYMTQSFIKEGFEGTVKSHSAGSTTSRRNALAEHFGNK